MRPKAFSAEEPPETTVMIDAAQANALSQAERAVLERPCVRVSTGDRNRGPQSGQEPADENQRGFILMNATHNDVAVAAQLGVAVQPMDAIAEQVEPELIADGSAQSTSDENVTARTASR